MIAWLVLTVAGITVTVVSSRVAVEHVAAVATRLAIAPFIIGVTLASVGTDLPEVANSIVASVNGHGDLNVGDSIGSAATQLTLVLGLLPLAGGAFVVARRRVPDSAVLTLLALALGAGLVADGQLSRPDGALLVASWVAATVYLWRHMPPEEQPELPIGAHSSWWHAMVALVGFAGVAAGAWATVTGVVRVADLLGVPLFVISFFAVSVGTSLPELAVDIVALRRGQIDIAIGDVVGSSLLDASLSIGIGPLVAPTEVSAGLALRGMVAAAIAVVAVLVLFRRERRHGRLTGAALLGLYALLYPVVLTA